MVNVIGLSVKTRHSRLYFCIVWHKLFVNLTDCFLIGLYLSYIAVQRLFVQAWFGLV